jgi:hypothetical protein
MFVFHGRDGRRKYIISRLDENVTSGLPLPHYVTIMD